MSENTENTEKKFLSYDGLETLVEKIKSYDAASLTLSKEYTNEQIAANKVVVDAELSETSSNPVENKAIKAEFQAVSDKLDEVASVQADWDVSDETSAAYVKNRTHYDDKRLYFSAANNKTVSFRQNSEYGVGSSIDGFDNQMASDFGRLSVWAIINGDYKYVDIEYVVTINNYEYIAVPSDEYAYAIVALYGDNKDVGVHIDRNGNINIDNLNYNGEEWTISVDVYIKETKQLDEKFIPDTIARLSYTDDTYALKSDFQSLEESLAEVYETKENVQTIKEELDSKITDGLDGKADSEHTHAVASETSDGFMSAADKIKLDGIDPSLYAKSIGLTVTGEDAMITWDSMVLPVQGVEF